VPLALKVGCPSSGVGFAEEDISTEKRWGDRRMEKTP
jgi:hypothetical protein